MKRRLWAAVAAIALYLLAPQLSADELVVDLNLPRIDTAEYHRPYVAVWLEDSQRRQVLQIALWLEQEKWHRDLRSWWRRGGSKLALPIDGISGATRKPGDYRLVTHTDLPAGRYTLNVEAVREVGGREHLRFPFEWTGETLRFQQPGQTELGPVSLLITAESTP
ncbi:MAG: DUF2271 domain-containing protein [Halioglobus sp.]